MAVDAIGAGMQGDAQKTQSTHRKPKVLGGHGKARGLTNADKKARDAAKFTYTRPPCVLAGAHKRPAA
eukprot:337590-Chlamydomonas_euryale.AAC.1